MRLLLASALFVLAAPSAHANQCDAGNSATANYEIPSGCPLRVYFDAGTPLDQVKLVTNAHVDVTNTVTPLGPIDLPIHYDEPDYANQCSDHTFVEPYTYDAYDITFTANLGELLLPQNGGNRWSIVVAAGACPTPGTFDGTDWIRCSATVQEYDACHNALCTPFRTSDADCEEEGSGSGSDEIEPGNPNRDEGGCAATTGGSIGALGGPLALLLVAFLRRRR